MHEHDATAALHHAPRRHRRIDPTRQQRRHRSAHAHRQSPRTGRAVQIDERLRRQHLDVHGDGGIAQIHARRDAAEHERAELTVHLHARQRIGLECAARGDPEGRELPPVHQRRHRRLHRVERRGHPVDKGDGGDAEDA
jgi:hypothetical protein